MEELDTAYVTFDGADLEAFNAVEKRDKRGVGNLSASAANFLNYC